MIRYDCRRWCVNRLDVSKLLCLCNQIAKWIYIWSDATENKIVKWSAIKHFVGDSLNRLGLGGVECKLILEFVMFMWNLCLRCHHNWVNKMTRNIALSLSPFHFLPASARRWETHGNDKQISYKFCISQCHQRNGSIGSTANNITLNILCGTSHEVCGGKVMSLTLSNVLCIADELSHLCE